jgi:glycosyltransferase involved in cell wall biosynthesis
MASPDTPIVYILGAFPQASQTFIAREIRGLFDTGVPLTVYSMRRLSPEALEAPDRQWFGRVTFVPRSPMPSSIAALLWWFTHHRSRLKRAFLAVVFLPHRPRYLQIRSVLLVVRAAWIAREIVRSGGCRLVHAHFALAQTEVAMAVSALLRCPFSFTAHARDIYATPNALPEKVRAASLVVTCTGYNVEYLRTLCPDLPGERIKLVYHGVAVPGLHDTGPISSPPVILAAGRLVEKKGFDDLIAACALLKGRPINFRCRIVGHGPAQSRLTQLIHEKQLEDVVTIEGWKSPGELQDKMRQAALVVMPSRITEQGDRDGIPNVVLEAMAQGRPVVATNVSGIPEAVQDSLTGLLVPAGNPASLADALARVLSDPDAAQRMGTAGRARILETFDLEKSSARLAAVFKSTVAGDR